MWLYNINEKIIVKSYAIYRLLLVNMLTLEEILVIVGGLCVRAMMSIHPHSGQGTPPMYGDYEAQRHWQEITVNLPISEWYFDTRENNLTYWGLDYPPLTAYHSLILGKVAKSINPSYVTLNESRGYETPQHKNFMRSTVLLSDILVFAPAVVAFGRAAHSNMASNNIEIIPKSLLTISLLLTYPGLILIDNGHFQVCIIYCNVLNYYFYNNTRELTVYKKCFILLFSV